MWAPDNHLEMAAVPDRAVLAASKIVLEPVFEAGILPCRFTSRPQRSAHDALQLLFDKSYRSNGGLPRRTSLETAPSGPYHATR